MHLLMLLVAMSIACLLRIAVSRASSWRNKWQRSLFFLIFPPLLLLMTSLAVLCMGNNGKMLGLEGTLIGYIFALSFLLWAVYSLGKLAYQGQITCLDLSKHPQALVCGQLARIVETEFPYSAQIGFWQPQLAISTGLLQSLDEGHLEAVIAHELAHKIEHHTFWFFLLGWLRTITACLPHSEELWQELLFWRELRADERATQQVDPLVLAEALITVAQTTLQDTAKLNTSFSCSFASQRLPERIDALLSSGDPPPQVNSSDWFSWCWILLVFVPWMTVPFHY